MLTTKSSAGRQRGISLIVTLVVTAGVAVVVSSVLCLSASRTTFTRRISQYERSMAAAVAATQKVQARIATDFQRGGDVEVNDNVANYTSLVPTAGETLAALASVNPSAKSPWVDEQFVNVAGQVNQISVQKRADWDFRELRTRLTGLKGYAADYAIVSTSRRVNGPYQIAATVRQDIQVASIPLFQYQIFYVPNMEIHPSGGGMTFNGRVHGNANIYCKPEGVVTFQNHVTAARNFISARHPGDPVAPGGGHSVCRGERIARVNTLNIPTGTSNTPTNLRALIEYPPLTELPSSPLGRQRFYNKADLVVMVSNNVVFARSGPYNAGLVPIPWIESRGIVTTGKKIFYDKRESRESSTTELNVAALLANHNDLTLLLGRPVKIVWIADFRTPNSTTIYGIRIVNGQTLPAAGLTIATPNSMYIYGHYNAPAANLGTTNTAGAAPACLASDSITFLSSAWFDGNGPKNLADRPADDMTVNAGIITGIVPTGGGNYSGGVENAIRVLENWSGKTLTFNGALAVLFHSVRANSPWGGPDVYSPPARKFSYDWKFSQPSTQPPGTPEVRTILHSDWTVVSAASAL